MRKFADLFKGRDDAYGWYGPLSATRSERGKRTGQAQTVRGAVTPELYAAHLRGEQRLGIAPVLDDGTCWWACIDIDFYKAEITHEEIASRIKETGLPLVLCKSKSDGMHLWCFFDAPIASPKARKMMFDFCSKLALPKEHIDIFPVQDKPKDIGNWVNLPYFGKEAHCLGETGDDDLSLEEFEAYANRHIQHETDLKKKAKAPKTSRPDMPPCIQFMQENGVPEGYRNNAVTQFAIYAKKKWPDDWRDKVTEFNDEHCDPSMEKHELRTIFHSMDEREYQYMCDKIKPMFCDLKECKLREFGVGDADPEVTIIIDSFEKIDGEEPVYRVTMDGKKFQVNLEQLFNYQLFKRVALGATNRFLPILKQAQWEDFMQKQLENMNIEQAAADTQTRERVVKIFKRFGEKCNTEKIETAIKRNVAFYDGEGLIFRGDDFLNIVDKTLTRLPRERTWSYMKDFGCVLIEMTLENGSKQKFWKWLPGPTTEPIWFDPYRREKK